MPCVEILLATCNSSRFLSQQLDSLLAQDHSDIRIVVRDDGSEDGTRDIVGQYASRDGRISLLEDHTPSGSAKSNFFKLLAASRADYVMTCDADDWWYPDKVSRTLLEMQKLEDGSPSVPCLVHCDLAVADEDLNVISPSLVKYEKMSPERTALNQLVCQNVVTGCAMMVNRALVSMIGPEPCAVMHDWWCALIASAFGRISFIKIPLIKYRQHSSNQVGAYNASEPSVLASRLSARERNRAVYDSMFRQAGAFADEYSDILSEEQLKVLRGYSDMVKLNHFQRCGRIISGNYWKNTFIRNVGQFLII
ncbi:MAG: glycosyltransferase family 2 protein [Oscillospiraceae bacterium]|jgi:glycosyltransferase involved in cell wall biosynthesis